MLSDVLGAIVKKDGDIAAHYLTPGKQMGDCLGAAECVAAAIGELMATMRAMQVADDLAAAWDLGSRFAEAYALAKREGGLADFDDLISIAGSLLRLGQFGEWVRFKLDQRTDHILVDEAQDTNTRQWAIVAALAEEFFAGTGAKDERVRTMFTVGDRKQAIFGFPGHRARGVRGGAYPLRRMGGRRRPALRAGRPGHQLPVEPRGARRRRRMGRRRRDRTHGARERRTAAPAVP